MGPTPVMLQHLLLVSLVDGDMVLRAGISGLVNALKILQPIKDKYSGVTYADLFQLASATAIEVVLTLTLETVIEGIYKINKLF